MLSLIRSVLVSWGLRAPERDEASGAGELDESRLLALLEEARRAPPFRRDALLKTIAQAMVRTTGPALVRYCALQLQGDRTRAEDAAQKAFTTFWRHLPRFEGRSSLKTWLYGIAYNHCRQDRRDDRRDRHLEGQHEGDIRVELHDDVDDLDTLVDREARRRHVIATIDTMEAREAWLLKARLFEHLDYDQMLAPFRARFGDSIKTIPGLRTAFFHAKARLVDKLEAR